MNGHRSLSLPIMLHMPILLFSPWTGISVLDTYLGGLSYICTHTTLQPSFTSLIVALLSLSLSLSQQLYQYHRHRHHPRLSSDTISSDLAMPVTTTVAAGTTTTTKLMGKPHQERQQQQEALRCPRCDSSNTKFCYYNNYSLSQPRHFCKACKRYWTLGGTLRNVPVGGGCRRNKRVKRHASMETLQSRSTADIITTNPITATTGTTSTVGTNNIPPIYNFAAAGGPHPNGLSDFATSSAGLDLPPMLNSIWLNFPTSATDHHHLANYTSHNPNHIQVDTLNSSDHPNSLLNSSTSSLLTTTLHQQKLMMGLRDHNRPSSDFHLLFPMGDLHQSTPITNVSSSLFMGVKMNHDQDGLSMTIPYNTNNETMAASNVSTHWGAANAGGVATNWSEATSYGSSITPLI